MAAHPNMTLGLGSQGCKQWNPGSVQNAFHLYKPLQTEEIRWPQVAFYRSKALPRSCCPHAQGLLRARYPGTLGRKGRARHPQLLDTPA